ncbi:MAG: hypothetical protein KDB22_18190 [Planctomycetales bacterium]|nr:hypothetical protein [Planctomycetales bacterium]
MDTRYVTTLESVADVTGLVAGKLTGGDLCRSLGLNRTPARFLGISRARVVQVLNRLRDQSGMLDSNETTSETGGAHARVAGRVETPRLGHSRKSRQSREGSLSQLMIWNRFGVSHGCSIILSSLFPSQVARAS